MPRGVAWAVEARKTREGSGVAPGANTLFIVLCGSAGENGMLFDGGLSGMVDARKILRAADMDDLLMLLAGISSRVVNVLRDEAAVGVAPGLDGRAP